MELRLVLRAVLFCIPLMAAAITDLRSRTIPYTACVLIAAAGLIDFSPTRLWGLVLAVPFFIASGFNRGGAGDIFLVAASAFTLGLKDGAAGLVLGLSCFVLYDLAAAVMRDNRPACCPLAPFFAVGFITAYFI